MHDVPSAEASVADMNCGGDCLACVADAVGLSITEYLIESSAEGGTYADSSREEPTL